jgi:hypothetical protein
MLFLVVEPDHEIAWTLRAISLEQRLYFVSSADEAREVVREGYLFDGIICEDPELEMELRAMITRRAA